MSKFQCFKHLLEFKFLLDYNICFNFRFSSSRFYTKTGPKNWQETVIAISLTKKIPKMVICFDFRSKVLLKN